MILHFGMLVYVMKAISILMMISIIYWLFDIKNRFSSYRDHNNRITWVGGIENQVDLEPFGEFEALDIFANKVTRKNIDLVMIIHGTGISYSSYQLYG